LTNGQDTWSARCGESRTPGAASGSGKRAGRKVSTAPRPDSTGQNSRSGYVPAGPDPQSAVVAWQAALDGAVYASPLVIGGR
ncbi:MAG: hypothetical protein ACR2G2_02980, partial [Pseudonocardia sp.]